MHRPFSSPARAIKSWFVPVRARRSTVPADDCDTLAAVVSSKLRPWLVLLFVPGHWMYPVMVCNLVYTKPGCMYFCCVYTLFSVFFFSLSVFAVCTFGSCVVCLLSNFSLVRYYAGWSISLHGSYGNVFCTRQLCGVKCPRSLPVHVACYVCTCAVNSYLCELACLCTL